MSEWAPLLRDAVCDHYRALGLEPEGRIGNPTVGGTFKFCGLEVHVDFGHQSQNALYRTVDPWPTPLEETQSYISPRANQKLAADFTITALDCVPQRNDDGTIPSDDEHNASVDEMATLIQGMFDALAAAQVVWNSTPGRGRIHFDPINPVEQSGLHAGCEVRVVVPIC